MPAPGVWSGKARSEGAKAAAGEATEYAQEHCMKYFEFQYTWGDIMARMESDGGLRQALVQAIQEEGYTVA